MSGFELPMDGEPARSYIRAINGDFVRVGKAEWMHAEDVPELMPKD